MRQYEAANEYLRTIKVLYEIELCILIDWNLNYHIIMNIS